MANQVIVDYEALQRAASAFEQQSMEIQNMLNSMNAQIDVLRGGEWIGTGASAFYDEMDSLLLPAVQRLIAALQEGSSITNQTLAQFQQADEETQSVWNPF
jgi:WXG100 family type VII secretion target